MILKIGCSEECKECTAGTDPGCSICFPDSVLQDDNTCIHMYDYNFSSSSANKYKNGDDENGQEIILRTNKWCLNL